MTVYLDASALLKVVAPQAESDALSAYLAGRPNQTTSIVQCRCRPGPGGAGRLAGRLRRGARSRSGEGLPVRSTRGAVPLASGRPA